MRNAFSLEACDDMIYSPVFGTEVARNLLQTWCSSLDSLDLKFVERSEWEQVRRECLFLNNESGRCDFLLPSDIRLWELVDVIKQVDNETYQRNPENKLLSVASLISLGGMFDNAGRYFYEYLDVLDSESKVVAEGFISKFREYGMMLKNSTSVHVSKKLSELEKSEVEKWFLGDIAYSKRIARLPDNPTAEDLEELRIKLLNVYFKALIREGFQATGVQPWELCEGPMKKLQDATQISITNAIESPKVELYTSVFKRGCQKLITGIKRSERFLSNDQSRISDKAPNLFESLNVVLLKQELDDLRSNGDLEALSARELEIAQMVWKLVSSYNYKSRESKLLDIRKHGVMNCLGASILAGSFLDELGVKYMHARLPQHSATVLITSDQKIYWQDFTPCTEPLNENYQEITQDMLTDDSVLDVSKDFCVLKFNDFKPYKHISGTFTVELVNPQTDLEYMYWQSLNLSLRDELGIEAYMQMLQFDALNTNCFNYLDGADFVFFTLGYYYYKLGDYESSERFLQRGLEKNPLFTDIYERLGFLYFDKGEYTSALSCFAKVIELDKDNIWAYIFFGNCLVKLDDFGQASIAFSHAGLLYKSMGKIDLAVEYLTQAVSLSMSNSSAALSLGELYLSMEKYPKDVQVCQSIGSAYFYAGDFDKAFNFFIQLFDAEVKDPYVFFQLGLVCEGLGKLDEAIEFLYSAGRRYLESGEARLAVTIYDKLLSMQADRGDFYLGFARANEQIGEYQDAIMAYENFIRVSNLDIGYLKLIRRKIDSLKISDNKFT